MYVLGEATILEGVSSIGDQPLLPASGAVLQASLVFFTSELNSGVHLAHQVFDGWPLQVKTLLALVFVTCGPLQASRGACQDEPSPSRITKRGWEKPWLLRH